MILSFSFPRISYSDEAGRRASEIFLEETTARLGAISHSGNDIGIVFRPSDAFSEDDGFSILTEAESLIFSAKGIRGYIFAIGYFFRKTEVRENKINLLYDIDGTYIPYKKIRGHQLGYRQTSNTYDAWNMDDYRRYYLDLMYFGTNTVEHIPYENGKSDRNAIMKYDEQELLCDASALAEEFNLKVSVWYPNSEKELTKAKDNREKLFSSAKRLDYIFPPGGDPGEIPPEELMERCREFRKILKKYHPEGEMWPSAQQPHHLPDWGIRFLREMNRQPDFIDGVVTGPNAAFPLDILRRYLPKKYPIRLYPDITHNLRCEYPVHFDRDDWHYALQVVNGRECANPRPSEYKKIHENTRGYVVGSVSYSEGVNDDINKAVWTALDFNPDTPVREILEDYSRLFFIGADYEKAADAILGLEKNWEGAPEENPSIESTLKAFIELGEKTPSLKNNWRYLQCLLRAVCDAFVRRKLLAEKRLISQARLLTARGQTEKAYSLLKSPLPSDVQDLRKEIDRLADILFNMIGLQYGTEKYYARNFERGAILDTVDLALTDLPWLISRFEATKETEDKKRQDYLLLCFDKDKTRENEYLFSVALNGLCPGGVTQKKGFYMNIQGDRPDKNNGSLPVSLFKLYDHLHFRLKAGGLNANQDYILRITYRETKNTDSPHHKVTINGNTVYEGRQFGGVRNTDYEKDFLAPGFIATEYTVPCRFIINGCVDLQISEPVNGFEIAQLSFTLNSYSSSVNGGTI